MKIRTTILLICMTITGCILLTPSAPSQDMNGAFIIRLNGIVHVQTYDPRDVEEARMGMLVPDGAKVTTAPASKVTLRMKNGNMLSLSGESSMVVNLTIDEESEREKTYVNLSAGQLYARAKKQLDRESSFEVKTPTAVSKVRGTDFSVKVAGMPENWKMIASAVIKKVDGNVVVRKSGGQDWAPAVEGVRVSTDDSIRTDARSSCVIAWSRGNIAKLEPLTFITIDELIREEEKEVSRLTLQSGRTVVRAKKLSGEYSEFEVRTPTATAGVRGTKFAVEVSGGAPPEQALKAEISDIKGNVKILRSGGFQWEMPENYETLGPGVQLLTGPRGSCALAWRNGNAVRVAPMSKIEIGKMFLDPASREQKTELSLEKGKAFIRAGKLVDMNNDFQVRTPTAVAGVRGTKFSVGVSGGSPEKGGYAVIASLEGKVELLREGTDTPAGAEKDMKVFAGDTIKTGPGGKCSLAWNRGNVAVVTPLTTLKIDLLESSSVTGTEKSSFNLTRGSVFAKAKKLNNKNSSFTVRTPVALAGVRGTTFKAEIDENKKMTAKCLDGALAVTGEGGEEVIVGAGMKTGVSEGEAPGEARQMSQEELAEFGEISELSDPELQKIGSAIDEAAVLTSVSCVEGEVYVASSSGGEVVVGKGQKTSVAEGEAPAAPGEIPASEMQLFDDEAGLDDIVAPAGAGASADAQQQKAKTEIQCAEGSLEVVSGAGEPVTIGAGQATVVAENAAPSAPVELSPAQLEAIGNDADLNNPALLEVSAAETPAGGADTMTTVACANGSVAVSSTAGGGPVVLSEGMKLSVKMGDMPGAPQQMTAEEKAGLNIETEQMEDASAAAGPVMGRSAGAAQDDDEGDESRSEESGEAGAPDTTGQESGPDAGTPAPGVTPDYVGADEALDILGESIDAIMDETLNSDIVDTAGNSIETYDLEIEVEIGAE